MALYSGVAASWESLCEGSDYGACGTCRNSLNQFAWQNLSGFSGCYCGCRVAALSCGDKAIVYDPCTGYSVCASVADHGPGSASCSASVSNCSAKHDLPRIIDLTKAAFGAIADPSLGVIPVSVQTSPTSAC